MKGDESIFFLYDGHFARLFLAKLFGDSICL